MRIIGNLAAKYCTLKYMIMSARWGSGTKVCQGSIRITRLKSFFIGDNSKIMNGCFFQSDGGILIGNNVVISRNVQILSASHDYMKGIPFHPTDYKTKLTEIQDGCFVGQNVIILPGTILGKRCVVQSGALLHGSYPDDSLIFGNASRHFRKLDKHERQSYSQSNDS